MNQTKVVLGSNGDGLVAVDISSPTRWQLQSFRFFDNILNARDYCLEDANRWCVYVSSHPFVAEVEFIKQYYSTRSSQTFLFLDKSRDVYYPVYAGELSDFIPRMAKGRVRSLFRFRLRGTSVSLKIL